MKKSALFIPFVLLMLAPCAFAGSIGGPVDDQLITTEQKTGFEGQFRGEVYFDEEGKEYLRDMRLSVSASPDRVEYRAECFMPPMMADQTGFTYSPKKMNCSPVFHRGGVNNEVIMHACGLNFVIGSSGTLHCLEGGELRRVKKK